MTRTAKKKAEDAKRIMPRTAKKKAEDAKRIMARTVVETAKKKAAKNKRPAVRIYEHKDPNMPNYITFPTLEHAYEFYTEFPEYLIIARGELKSKGYRNLNEPFFSNDNFYDPSKYHTLSGKKVTLAKPLKGLVNYATHLTIKSLQSKHDREGRAYIMPKHAYNTKISSKPKRGKNINIVNQTKPDTRYEDTRIVRIYPKVTHAEYRADRAVRAARATRLRNSSNTSSRSSSSNTSSRSSSSSNTSSSSRSSSTSSSSNGSTPNKTANKSKLNNNDKKPLTLGSLVWYKGIPGGKKIAQIVGVHRHDPNPPSYTIYINGQERQTVRGKLEPMVLKPSNGSTPKAQKL